MLPTLPVYDLVYVGAMCGMLGVLVASLVGMHASRDRREQGGYFGGALLALAAMVLLMLLGSPAHGMDIAGGPVMGDVPEVPAAACKGDPNPVPRGYFEIRVGGTAFLPVTTEGGSPMGGDGSQVTVQKLPAGLARPHYILDRVDALDDGVYVISGEVAVHGTEEGLWEVRVRCSCGKVCGGVVLYQVRVRADPPVRDPHKMLTWNEDPNAGVERRDDHPHPADPRGPGP